MHQHNIFVNRILNMNKIKYIGLDMDHTLVRYQAKNSEELVYKYTIDELIFTKNYPDSIRTLKFKFQDAIRGLLIDSKNGNILKVSRFGGIRKSFHGTREMSFEETRKKYQSYYADLSNPNYLSIDTYFSIALCVLYGQLVDMKDKDPELFPDYSTMAYDIITSIDLIHQAGALKEEIIANFDKYIIQEKAVVDGIKRYLNYGKKFFILTNSDFYYTDKLLSYTIDPYLEGNQRWYDLFEYVITQAAKPKFFTERMPFLSVDPDTGLMSNYKGPLVPGIYQGGCAMRFTESLDVVGDNILYIGDHIYGDILRLKKACKWRTALVIEELGSEIEAQIKSMHYAQRIDEYMEVKTALEKKYVSVCSSRIEAGEDINECEEAYQLQQKAKRVDVLISALIKKQDRCYNKKWDKMFRVGAEETFFAYEVDRFACIYMEKLSDLLEHSPISYFRAHRRFLAHEVHLSTMV